MPLLILALLQKKAFDAWKVFLKMAFDSKKKLDSYAQKAKALME